MANEPQVCDGRLGKLVSHAHGIDKLGHFILPERNAGLNMFSVEYIRKVLYPPLGR